MKKLIIVGTEAHFKIPLRSQIQSTYDIPPISTVVGMLKNIYGDDINDFELGYYITYDGKNREIIKLYKEVNPNARTLTCSDRFVSQPTYIENLVNPRLVIYHNIDRPIKFEKPLTLGKANYLANICFTNIELEHKEGIGYNQYTPISIGDGMIRRINTLTLYNEDKGVYDYKMVLVRENLSEFEIEDNYDKDEDINIYIWKWKDGNIC